ncbi:hypothetical protein [Jeotgalibacillus malaysiensis]|uniref:hypothetical protein n=1 Tax=Jeotgalibacillus malaysiensis TaxID=1508404 RepID=UPI00384D7D27
MTEKQLQKVLARIEELTGKALDRDQGSLSKAEIDELRSLLKKVHETKKKNTQDENKKLSEIAKENISMSVSVVFGEEALKVAEEKFQKSLPLQERMKSMKTKMEELEKFYQKQTPKLQAEAERLKEKNRERQIQEDYLKKYNYPL